MTAVVVYESLWGNTAAIARAIAEGIGPTARALATDQASADVLADADLVVAGAPVLAFSLPSDMIRNSIATGEKRRTLAARTCRIHRCVHGSHPCRPGTVVQPSSRRVPLVAGRRDRGDQQRVEASRLPAGGQGEEVPGHRQVRTASRGGAGAGATMGRGIGRRPGIVVS